MLEKIAMRVAMYYNNQDVWLEEMNTPQIRLGEVLMRVKGTKCALA